uniref:subtilisin n=1 Tax=Chromera velia CCMP2878 TaxID=1169474 RepID=A0A0G4GJD4_9ALVE|eukprot:Cvel_22124.t1-p1 / transcript=Cvel_22124.t1 / gene=Cvel_22124 / organism=Chromera_velia_CCMP2878 / gene_product=Alkaline serine exoprotease A, putative / transcript_product=Alkaline serine exoprotease A, putative / location=Cvel_scaffold2144:13719-20635(-) / protein_length=1007 / sequence_SO=supercontig / SO=protein_coding / is_pseudo=false
MHLIVTKSTTSSGKDEGFEPYDEFHIRTLTTACPAACSYIFDTGVEYNHQEFSGRTGTGVDFMTGTSTGSYDDDCNGHGTHCAGSAAGANVGVATGATVHSLRVLDCSGSGSTLGVIQALSWMVSNAETPAIASMSLGSSVSSAVNDAVQSAVNAGITVIAAAGNDNQNASGYSPASAPAAITVASSTNTDARSSFSNFGSVVDIFAPGSSILSAWCGPTGSSQCDSQKGEANGYAILSGTSMATPHVAGAVAILLQISSHLQSAALSGKISDVQGSRNFLLYVRDLVRGLRKLCAANQYVSSHACTACPPGTTNAANDDTSGADTSCDATLCAANQYVSSHVCTACTPGTTNAANDDASGVDTTCDATLCTANQYVSSHVCTACPPGTTNAANDNAASADTTCDATKCAVNQYVSSHVCTACPPGTTNAANDDASGADTTCDSASTQTVCAKNQYVSSNSCVACPPGTTNARNDNYLGADTTCDATLCGANQYVSSHVCTVCPPGTTNAANDDASGADTRCDERNECAANVHNCDTQALCTNTPLSFTCTCNRGYTGDGLKCTASEAKSIGSVPVRGDDFVVEPSEGDPERRNRVTLTESVKNQAEQLGSEEEKREFVRAFVEFVFEQGVEQGTRVTAEELPFPEEVKEKVADVVLFPSGSVIDASTEGLDMTARDASGKKTALYVPLSNSGDFMALVYDGETLNVGRGDGTAPFSAGVGTSSSVSAMESGGSVTLTPSGSNKFWVFSLTFGSVVVSVDTVEESQEGSRLPEWVLGVALGGGALVVIASVVLFFLWHRYWSRKKMNDEKGKQRLTTLSQIYTLGKKSEKEKGKWQGDGTGRVQAELENENEREISMIASELADEIVVDIPDSEDEEGNEKKRTEEEEEVESRENPPAVSIEAVSSKFVKETDAEVDPTRQMPRFLASSYHTSYKSLGEEEEEEQSEGEMGDRDEVKERGQDEENQGGGEREGKKEEKQEEQNEEAQSGFEVSSSLADDVARWAGNE